MRRSLLVFLVSVFSLSACIQAYNSSSQDKAKYGKQGDSQTSGTQKPGAETSGSVEFQRAQAVMAEYCQACHDNEQEGFGVKSAADLLTLGWYIPGDADHSKIYMALKGSLAPLGLKNMPVDPMPAEDVETIRAWINSEAILF